MKKKDAEKKEDFIDHLDSLIAITEKEIQKQKDKNKIKVYAESLTMLEALRRFTTDLVSFYFNSDGTKILTWEEVLSCITFIKDVVFHPYFSNKDQWIEIDDTLFRKFLAFVYEKKNWGKDDWVPLALSDNLNTLLLFYFPDYLLKKIKLPKKPLALVNHSLFQVCRSSHYYKVSNLLKSLLKNSEFLSEFNAFFILFDFISAHKGLESFNKKHCRLITWDECNTLLKEKLQFIENLFEKNNWKIEPNKKYTAKMFEFVNQKRLEGLKCYVAYRQTLEKFGFHPDKEDSFRKQYNAYLKKRK